MTTKLTKDDLATLEEGLDALLYDAQQRLLSTARSHYLVPGPNGEPVYFSGTWDDLLKEFERIGDRHDEYDRLEQRIAAVREKLRAKPAKPRKAAKR